MKHVQNKQPSEVIPCNMDFVKALPAGETLDTFEVTVSVKETGVDATADILSGTPVKSGTQVKAVVKDGIDGEVYKVTFRANTTPSAYILEEDVELQVNEL